MDEEKKTSWQTQTAVIWKTRWLPYNLRRKKLMPKHMKKGEKKNTREHTNCTSAAVNRFFGLYWTRPSTSAISLVVVQVGNIFCQLSPLLCGKLYERIRACIHNE